MVQHHSTLCPPAQFTQIILYFERPKVRMLNDRSLEVMSQGARNHSIHSHQMTRSQHKIVHKFAFVLSLHTDIRWENPDSVHSNGMERRDHQSIVITQLHLSSLVLDHALHLGTAHHHIINFEVSYRFELSVGHQDLSVTVETPSAHIVILGHIHGSSCSSPLCSAASATHMGIGTDVRLGFGRGQLDKHRVAGFLQFGEQSASVVLDTGVLEVVAILMEMRIDKRRDVMFAPFMYHSFF